MDVSNPRSTVALFGRPLHAMLVPFPIACFVGTLLTDIVYWRTAAQQWANFSVWLLTAGLVVAGFAVLAGVIDFLSSRRIRAIRAAWVHGLVNALVLVLSVVNAFVHSRDAYTSVVPTGITLSAIVVLLLLVSGWNGWSLVYRHGVGVRSETDR